MKIFISHSSLNAGYGSALVELLTSIGITHDKITFTSDTSYGIPAGENIFKWLKGRISEKPFVIYLLSPEYFSSVACLNEMGAAWVVENQHVAIFTPTFDLASESFRNSVLDPREMGFRLNDSERLAMFAEQIKSLFDLSTNQVIISRACQKCIDTVDQIASEPIQQSPQPRALSNPTQYVAAPRLVPEDASSTPESAAPGPIPAVRRRLPPAERFFKDFDDGKLKDEEILLIFYASDTGRFSLGVGWRADEEKQRIVEWEELNEFSDTLSKGYDAAINRLEVRTLTEVSERTSHGNPRQIDFVQELKDQMLDLSENFHIKAEEIIHRDLEKKSNVENPFPF